MTGHEVGFDRGRWCVVWCGGMLCLRYQSRQAARKRARALHGVVRRYRRGDWDRTPMRVTGWPSGREMSAITYDLPRLLRERAAAGGAP